MIEVLIFLIFFKYKKNFVNATKFLVDDFKYQNYLFGSLFSVEFLTR